MTFRDIVVDACPGSDLEDRLERTRELAAAFGARLTVVSYAWPRMSPIGEALTASAIVAQEQTALAEEALQQVRTAVERVLGSAPVESESCFGIAEPFAALRDHLLTADLLVTGSSESGPFVGADPAQLAVHTGAPVLRLGSNSGTHSISNILVAWKDLPAAYRAVHAALPLLRRARSVTVLGIGDEVDEDRLCAVAGHLRRHAVPADHRHVSQSHQDVYGDLMASVEQVGGDLVVSGVHGRGPLLEMILGGVSKAMLRNGEISWLMAH